MSQAISGADDRGRLPVLLQTKEDATAQHVATILNIVHVMRGLLIVPDDDTATRLDGEPKVAAQATLIKACARLDEILEDKERWSASTLFEIHKALVSVHKMQEKVLKSNLAYSEMVQRPSHQLKPTLATYGKMHFIAFWGKLEEPGMAIIGRGRTPSEALRDFDAAFHRTPEEQLQAISEAQQARESSNPTDSENQSPDESEPNS